MVDIPPFSNRPFGQPADYRAGESEKANITPPLFNKPTPAWSGQGGLLLLAVVSINGDASSPLFVSESLASICPFGCFATLLP
jgi:hypothetical protein